MSLPRAICFSSQPLWEFPQSRKRSCAACPWEARDCCSLSSAMVYQCVADAEALVARTEQFPSADPRAAANQAAAAYTRGEVSAEGLRAQGVPPGHPFVRSFLGAPLLIRRARYVVDCSWDTASRAGLGTKMRSCWLGWWLRPLSRSSRCGGTGRLKCWHTFSTLRQGSNSCDSFERSGQPKINPEAAQETISEFIFRTLDCSKLSH